MSERFFSWERATSYIEYWIIHSNKQAKDLQLDFSLRACRVFAESAHDSVDQENCEQIRGQQTPISLRHSSSEGKTRQFSN